MGYLTVACRVLLAVVFATSLVSKLRGRAAWSGFADSVRQLGRVPGPAVGMVATTVVAAEALALVLLLVPTAAPLGLAVSGSLLTGFTVVMFAGWRRGVRAPCRCFGASTVPVGVRHLVRNALLITVAGAGIAGHLAGASVAHPGGLAVAAASGLAAAAVLIVFDDLVDLLWGPAVVVRGAGEKSGRSG